MFIADKRPDALRCLCLMRATIDGKPVAFLQSPGIAHPTKSKVEFGCMGKDGCFDDLKIWNAEPSGAK